MSDDMMREKGLVLEAESVKIEPSIECDSNGNIIHYKGSNGCEFWNEYDFNGNIIHYRSSDGYEFWNEYDSKGNIIHYRNSNGHESSSEYDSNGNKTHYKNSIGHEEWNEYNSKGIQIKRLKFHKGIYYLNGKELITEKEDDLK